MPVSSYIRYVGICVVNREPGFTQEGLGYLCHTVDYNRFLKSQLAQAQMT